MKRLASLLILAVVGCNGIDLGLVKPVNPVDPSKPDPAKPVTSEFDPAAASEALARLAERCGKSESRQATQELHGTLNELVTDGVDPAYRDKVLQAVPAIGVKPFRDLKPDELAALRGVK